MSYLTVSPSGGGGGLTEVTSDDSLSGDGTSGSPLSVVNNYASTAQGALADSATQPGDGVSTLANDAGYITDAGVTSIVAGTNITISPVGGTGDVTINATGGGASLTDNVSAYYTTDSAPISTPFTQVLSTDTVYTADPAFTGTSVTFVGAGVGGLSFNVAGTYKVTTQISWETLPAGSKTDLDMELQIADAPAFGNVVARGLSCQHLETGDTAHGSIMVTKTFVIPAPGIYYLSAIGSSSVSVDVILKGDSTNYSFVEVIRLA